MRDRDQSAVLERPEAKAVRAENETSARAPRRTAETEEQQKAKKEYLESILSPGVE